MCSPYTRQEGVKISQEKNTLKGRTQGPRGRCGQANRTTQAPCTLTSSACCPEASRTRVCPCLRRVLPRCGPVYTLPLAAPCTPGACGAGARLPLVMPEPLHGPAQAEGWLDGAGTWSRS